jgi:dihydrofolate reductase
VVSSARTRVERAFDPAAVLRMKETAGRDISVGGPDLASQAMAAGLVDEMHLFLTPVTVGGGTPALPGHLHSNLELLRVDRFAGGVVHLQYRTSN